MTDNRVNIFEWVEAARDLGLLNADFSLTQAGKDLYRELDKQEQLDFQERTNHIGFKLVNSVAVQEALVRYFKSIGRDNESD